MKKLILAVLCCLILTVSAFAADITVSKLNTDCKVEENGDCEITQTVDLAIKNSVTDFTIPVGVNATNITVTGADNNIHSRDGNSYATFSAKDGFPANLQVKISYSTHRNVEKQEKGQLLTAELVSPLWEYPSDRYSFSVMLPKKTDAEPAFLSGYHADDVEDSLTVTKKDRAISGLVRGGLLDRESFTMTLAVPEGYFTSASGSANAGAGYWIIPVLMLLLAAAAIYYFFAFLRSNPLRVKARTMLPESATPAELPFLLAGKAPSFGLLVCHWASLGYLSITEEGGKIALVKKMDMGSECREEEQKLFSMLFATVHTVIVGSQTYQKVSGVAVRALRQYWIRRLFDRRSGNPIVPRIAATLIAALGLMNAMNVMLPPSGVKWLLMITAFIAGGACGTFVYLAMLRWNLNDTRAFIFGGASLLICYILARISEGGLLPMLLALGFCVLVGIFTRYGGKRTAAGNDLLEQCLGFRRFLSHTEGSQFLQMMQKDSQYFYKLLVSAEALGLGKVFARKLSGTKLEPCAWLQGKNIPQKAYAFYTYFDSVIRQMEAE